MITYTSFRGVTNYNYSVLYPQNLILILKAPILGQSSTICAETLFS